MALEKTSHLMDSLYFLLSLIIVDQPHLVKQENTPDLQSESPCSLVGNFLANQTLAEDLEKNN